jgi:predicted double-glycine peptidase
MSHCSFLNHTDVKNFMMLDFPEVRQSTNYTCGASALQAILYYYGLSYREDQLEHLLGVTKDDGTNPHNVIKLCQKLGFSVSEKHGMTLRDIRSYLLRKIPILVAYQAWGDNKVYRDVWSSGHYSVIIGILEDKLIFEDPSLIGRGYIRIAEFLDRWHDVDSKGNTYRHYGIMVYGKPIVYNSNKICPIE